MTEKKRKEFLVRRNDTSGKPEAVPVPVGTQAGLQARIVSLTNRRRDGLAYAGFEKIYDLKKKIYNVKQLTGDDLITFRPPHSQELKIALANAHESDPYLSRITKFYTDYVFGDEIKPRLVPLQINTPASRKENDDLVRKVISKKEHERFLRMIAVVNYMSGIEKHMKKIWQQSYVFGTAALWKTLSLDKTKTKDIEVPILTPVKLKPLDGFYLKNIHQDVDTMDPKYFEYINPNVRLDEILTKDRKKVIEISYRSNTKMSGDPVMLPWDRLIVVRRQNIGTTPNTTEYGISPILPTLYISENIRRIDEKILPEMNEGSYAGVGIFSVPEDSKYDIDKLAEDLSIAGTRIVLNSEITYTAIPVDFKLDGMLNQKVSLIKSEMMHLGVPESLFFPTDTNRSILEILINIWQNVDLNDERDLLSDTMWQYWYKHLMEITFPDEELIDLSLTVQLEFKNKSFTGFVDKAEQLLAYHLAGAISKKELREDIDHPPYTEAEEEELTGAQKVQADMPLSLEQQQQRLQTISTTKRINNKAGIVNANAKNTTAASSTKKPSK